MRVKYHFTKLNDSILSKSGVYKITNIINGKIYIGSTTIPFRKRFNYHKSNPMGCKYFGRAVFKYGINNFKFEIIEILDENIRERETFWIEFYESYKKEKGYNICRIAQNTTSEINSIKVVRFNDLLSEITIFPSLKQGALESNCSGGNVSVACKSVKHPTLRSRKAGGYFWCYFEDYKKGILPRNGLQIRNIRKGKVGKFDKDMQLLCEYKSLKEASEKENKDFSTIARCCRGENKTSYGYIWKYLK